MSENDIIGPYYVMLFICRKSFVKGCGKYEKNDDFNRTNFIGSFSWL